MTTSPAGRTRTVTVDDLGRPVRLELPGLAAVELSYDAHGRLVGTAQGSGAEVRTTLVGYDAAGRMTSTTDALNRTVSFAYDDADRVTQQTLPDGRQVAFTYDADGNLASLTPPGRPAHAFSYTPINLQSEYLPPDAQPPLANRNTQYTYNSDRQLTQVTRPDGLTIALGYDAAGRLATETLPGNEVVTSGYDASGNLSTLTGHGTTLALGYAGSVLTSETWSGPVAGSVSHSLDENVRVSAESVNGDSVSFAYDADDLLTQAGSETLTRDAQNGQLTGSSLGSVTDAIGRNQFGEPTGYTATASGSTVYDVQYTRDAGGRIAAKTETINGAAATVAYGYDVAGRLTDVTTNGVPTAHYDYDANGNRVGGFNQVCGTLGNVSIDAQDRLSTLDCGPATLSYTYTANGELMEKTVEGSQSTVYSYDVVGNLRSVVLPDGRTIDYVVDGRNRRIGKKVNGTLVQGFLYADQLRIAAELDGAGNVVSRFVYGSKANVPDYLVKDGVTYRIVSDHLGSPRLVVNVSDGTVAQRLEYDEFGNVLVDTNPGFQPFGVAGGLYDRDTGLVRFGARDYDPNTGRWTAKDPIGFGNGDWNLFRYVLNDPIDMSDATGWGVDAPTPVPVPSAPPPPHPPTPGPPRTYEDCTNAGPTCDAYSPSDTYFFGSNARCFCRCAPNDPWSQHVRCCLRNRYERNYSPDEAHTQCYREADEACGTGFMDRPWTKLVRCWWQCR